jgi:ABC-type transport system substrate-binding protein
MFKNRLVTFAVILVLAVALLPACQPQATETPAEVPTEGQAAPTQGQAAPTEVSPTEAPPTEVPPTEVAGPPVGGNFVFGVTEEPDTLDIYKSAFAVASLVTSNMGASLVAKNSEGQMVPYLAKSWEISEDGLTYTFQQRRPLYGQRLRMDVGPLPCRRICLPCVSFFASTTHLLRSH